MNKLIKHRPTRIFAFGCSFTNYSWPTWANIIAFDLDIPLYNYGMSGAGNQYIFNSIMQADNYYNFNQDDLIMVCWTNISREDRFIQGHWQLHGNIYSQSYYDKDFVKKYVNESNGALRDFAAIKAAYEFIKFKNCQFHFLKMLDFEFFDQWVLKEESTTINAISNQYSKYLEKIEKSFIKVLWNNDLTIKQNEEAKIASGYIDGHPNVVEHFTYLENVFEHDFTDATKDKVYNTNTNLVNSIRLQLSNNIQPWHMKFEDLAFANLQKVIII